VRDLLSGFYEDWVLEFIWDRLVSSVIIFGAPVLAWPILGPLLRHFFDLYLGPVIHDLLRVMKFEIVDWEKAAANGRYSKILDKIKVAELQQEDPSEEELSELRQEYREAMFDVVSVDLP
jgi:hypothetical protein